MKKETFDNKIKHLFDSIDSEKDVPYKPQLELTQFITLSSLDIPDEPKWSTKDTSKLIQLQEALGSNLDAMTKYFKERSRYSIRHHFFNILKWAAFEYSNDFNTGEKWLSKTFESKPELILPEPLTSDEEQLMNLVEVARFLIKTTSNWEDPTAKNIENASDNDGSESDSSSSSDFDAIINKKVARIKKICCMDFSQHLVLICMHSDAYTPIPFLGRSDILVFKSFLASWRE